MIEDEAVRLLFDDPVRVAVMRPSGDERALWPQERALIRRAVERRRKEFIAGRILARRLLRRMGVADQPLLCGEDRRPLWPQGITGSIAHSDTCCVVAVAPGGSIRALGVDVEERTPLDPAAWSRVVRPDEWRGLVRAGERATGADDPWLAARSERAPGTLITALFCIKECVLKCFASATGRALDFHSISVRLDGSHRFHAAILGQLDGHDAPTAATGRVRFTEGHILAGAVLPAVLAAAP